MDLQSEHGRRINYSMSQRLRGSRCGAEYTVYKIPTTTEKYVSFERADDVPFLNQNSKNFMQFNKISIKKGKEFHLTPT
jgi:hypothetical protein